MTDHVARRALDASLPDGQAWEVEPNGDLDKILDAMATNFEDTRTEAKKVESIRNPQNTDRLSDLEIDFGVVPDTGITTATRRAFLSAIKGERGTTCSWEFLENKLRAMGFDVRVYPNDPPISPEDVIPAAGYNSEWIVNGDVIWSQQKNYNCTCEYEAGTSFDMTCECDPGTTRDDYTVTADSFMAMSRVKYEYPYPTNPARWPYVFWIAKSMSGNERFDDWNMEWATTSAWTAGDSAALSKTLLKKYNGIRSLVVAAGATSTEPYAAQALTTAVDGARTVFVKCWADTGLKAALEVCDVDGVWDVAGRDTSADGAVCEQLTYNASNGVSAVRLMLIDGAGTVSEGKAAWFDNLRCEGLSVDVAEIPIEQKLNFRKAVLRYKPMRTWCGCLVDYTGDFALEEDDMSYRSVTTTPSGNLAITNNESDVHIMFKGTAAGYTVTFDDARTFDEDRLFRFTNQTTQNITFIDGGAVPLATLLPSTSIQFTLTDRTSINGNWLALGYMTGAGS